MFDGDPNLEEITAADLGGDYPAIEYTPPHGRYSLPEAASKSAQVPFVRGSQAEIEHLVQRDR